MLKDNKDTSTSGKLGIGCDEDLNTTEKADRETTIIRRMVVSTERSELKGKVVSKTR